MNPDVLKTNILAIAAAGLLMLLTGIVLYIFRDEVAENVRFFMPIPPLVVASYIFVFNLYNFYDGNLPQDSWTTVKEVLLSTAVAAIAFGIFSLLIIAVVDFTRR
jgi:ABC-type nitrate/sulfonate/bicarbonate transport system permease component